MSWPSSNAEKSRACQPLQLQDFQAVTAVTGMWVQHMSGPSPPSEAHRSGATGGRDSATADAPAEVSQQPTAAQRRLLLEVQRRQEVLGLFPSFLPWDGPVACHVHARSCHTSACGTSGIPGVCTCFLGRREIPKGCCRCWHASRRSRPPAALTQKERSWICCKRPLRMCATLYSSAHSGNSETIFYRAWQPTYCFDFKPAHAAHGFGAQLGTRCCACPLNAACDSQAS